VYVRMCVCVCMYVCMCVCMVGTETWHLLGQESEVDSSASIVTFQGQHPVLQSRNYPYLCVCVCVCRCQISSTLWDSRPGGFLSLSLSRLRNPGTTVPDGLRLTVKTSVGHKTSVATYLSMSSTKTHKKGACRCPSHRTS
jgi:hypothetical protein